MVRLSQFYGDCIEAELNLPDMPTDTPTDTPTTVYGMADGLMLHIDGAWAEVKLGRIFSQSDHQSSAVKDRAGQINRSLYVARVGHCDQFWMHWQAHLLPFEPLGPDLVLVNDGAPWLACRQQRDFTKATPILDYYHVMEHIGKLAQAAISQPKGRKDWIETQAKHLLSSDLNEVLMALSRLGKAPVEVAKVRAYLNQNQYRMDYKAYQGRGLCIGSGAIESATGAVVQQRLKRAGQRWSSRGAQRMLNLRCCWMSDRWQLVESHLRPASWAMAD